MEFWLTLVVFVVVCLTILMYLRKFKMPSWEGFGPMDEARAFGAFQSTYFHDTAPTEKGFFVNGNLSLTDLNMSLSQPELYLPKSPDRDYTTYFSPNPEDKYIDKNSFCKSASKPSDLPAHTSSTVDCGWYFIDDSSKPSIGLAGTIDGPLFTEDLPPNGVWMWDLALAQQKEEIKACKRMTKCFLVDLDSFKGKCGFCPTKGHGVPIFPNGQEKYLDSNGGFCGQPLVVSSSQCLLPIQATVTTSSGIQCKYGYPSPDNAQRYFNEVECTTLGGTYTSPSQCIASDGISFNDQCSALNIPVSVLASNSSNAVNGTSGSGVAGNAGSVGQGMFTNNQSSPIITTTPSICSPNTAGNLTPQCLLSIARGLGFADTGSIIRLISTNGTPNNNELIAIQTLTAAGISVPSAILGAGNIDTTSAGNIYNAIYNAMTAGSNPKIRASATLLVNGDVNFDPCTPEFIGNDTIPTPCLQQEFRRNGCQASGAAYPTESTAATMNRLPLSQVTSTFQNLYKSMSNATDQVSQANAVKDCLGIQYSG